MSEAVASPTQSTPFTALGRFIFWFSLIAVAIAVYYFFLFERGSEHVYRRNLRLLSHIERQINSGLDRFVQVASTRADTLDYDSTTQQIGGRTYPFIMRLGLGDGECKILRDPKLFVDGAFNLSAPGGNALLSFCIRSDSGNNYAYAEQIRLADFIKSGEALEQFHQILVFDSDRNLIYRSADDTGDLIKSNVYDLLDQNVTTHEAIIALPQDWLGDDNKKTLKPGKTDEKSAEKIDSTAIVPFSKVREFTIGEQDYLAFIHPMKLDVASIAKPAETPTWYVVGITTSNEFNTSRFVVPRWWMAIFLLVLALFILGTPYLKLRLMGPRDLIRSSTVMLTVVAMLFAAMIITIMLLNLSAYFLTEKHIRDQLHAGSQLLSSAFSNELQNKKEALSNIVKGENPDHNNLFSRVSIFDAEGNLTATLSDESSKVSALSVKKRNFWLQLEQRSRLPIDESDLTYSLDNIFNRIDSRFDERKTTILAKRVAMPAGAIPRKGNWNVLNACAPKGGSKPCEKSFSVVAANFSFNTFSHILLPKGYGFIVIDNGSGIVQYHTESIVDLTEQLYEETDNNSALKTAINTGSPDTFMTNYRGHRYLFHTRPLAYSKWTLITYFSQELLDRVNVGLLLSATGLSVGFLLLYMGGGVLGFRLLSHSKINLLWPNPAQAKGYFLLLIFLSVLTLTFISAITNLYADRLFSVVALIPLLAISGTYICLVKRYQPFQTLIAERSREHDAEQKLSREILKQDAIGLIAASVLIFVALLAINKLWLWQLLPYADNWLLTVLARGGGVLAVILLGAAYCTLMLTLRNRAAGERNAAADKRRALLHLLMLTASIVLIANLTVLPALFLIAAIGVVLTHPLRRHNGFAANRLRNRFFLPVDRRSDREWAYTLHRLCITLIIVVSVMLPAVAFYRDATSLYTLRWLQQDAQKLRARVERSLASSALAQPPSKPSQFEPAPPDPNAKKTEAPVCDFSCRFKKIIVRNEDLGLLPTDALSSPDALASSSNKQPSSFNATPKLTWLEQNETFSASDSAEMRLMHPITALSRNLARISGFSKIENDPADDAHFSTWRVIKDDSGQHLLGTIKLSYAEKWLQLYWPKYLDFGSLNPYRLWIWLAVAIFAGGVIYPMIRLILRELIAEADLRPYPALTPKELDLLLKNYRNTLLLVSGNSLDKSALDLNDLENDTVTSLQMQFTQSPLCLHRPNIATLPHDLNREDVAADIMVVSEQRWHELSTEQYLHNTVRTRVEDADPPTWEALLEGINKLRYPDDIPDLALGHWKLDRNCTLLVCRSIEAQTTLAAYAAEHGWHAQTLGKDVSDEKIWLHNIEDIIFKPARRKHLLGLLESLQTSETSRSIVLTGLILPHLWFTEKAHWHGEEINESELMRWLTVLTRINVRAVDALTVEQTMCEIHRSHHSLPRPSREAEYALWWRYSTPDERTALAALTHEGLINPYNRSVIRSLMARGLIFRGSTLRFSDKAFKLFVKHKYPAIQLRRQADIELQQSSWGAARGPLLIALAVFGYGVMVMGGGAFETMLGLATSIGASIPALLNLVRLMKRDAA